MLWYNHTGTLRGDHYLRLQASIRIPVTFAAVFGLAWHVPDISLMVLNPKPQTLNPTYIQEHAARVRVSAQFGPRALKLGSVLEGCRTVLGTQKVTLL